MESTADQQQKSFFFLISSVKLGNFSMEEGKLEIFMVTEVKFCLSIKAYLVIIYISTSGDLPSSRKQMTLVL